MNVLLPTLGSSGDVNPFIALGAALASRGHRATILTNPIFQAQIESHGLRFLAIGTASDAERTIADPELWQLHKGMRVVSRILIPAAEQLFRLIERHSDRDTVVAFSTLSLGARLAQEKLGVPSASVHLQPSVIRTLGDQGMLGNVRLAEAHPKWLKRALFRLADAAILDRYLKRPLNEIRARLGLAPVDRIMHRWLHSPQLVIGFFPPWFAVPQPDWPGNTHLVGFPLQDADAAARLDRALQFLDEGDPPVVFTPGSAGSTMQQFLGQSVEAARRAQVRAMLITNFPQQVPSQLPAGVEAFGYLPFSKVLPRSSLLVYHGGVGTLAQGIKAAVPHLVVPHAFDQFDSGWRIQRLGLGKSIPIGSYRPERAARAIRRLIRDAGVAQRCSEFAQCMDGEQAVARAVALIERLGGHGAGAAGSVAMSRM